MKKLSTLLIFLFTTINLHSQTINIPDVNFKNRLLAANSVVSIARNCNDINIVVDTNNNGEIEQNEALEVCYLFLHNALNSPSTQISSLEGINYFTNLKWLAINNNNISTLNISQLTNLWNFGCTNNPITTIDFSGLTSLKRVNVSNCLFSTLDFSGNPLFNELQCSNNPNLTTLKINNNYMQSFVPTYSWEPINWSNIPNLTTICADSFEVTALQNFLTSCAITQPITISTNCALENSEFNTTSFSVYPNPSKGVFTVECEHNIQNGVVEIYTLLGQKVFYEHIVDTHNKIISIQNISKGTYILKVVDNNTTAYKKLIID
ncbi:putative secreted protein (Por secretion system target) [Flavobacterium croceum DSM 17960]|uniref:Putative secreted protein (Por secretion system target) n=1 Tax=Flavobacterium croceum DSM 17960 TaxID=1121886 RepID=A0A2S4N8M1_9FLAO|nr:T9SS type A sorting domain-containing protein [Flavobacterium croceum]POS01783.1 putative secreted protein (Por secretion system target) [Flavobacterium croceum DSM 17960]